MRNIIFTKDIRTELSYVLEGVSKEDIFVLTDINTYNFCLPLIKELDLKESNVIIIQDGESEKSLENLSRVWLVLSKRGAKRNSLLINLGGGVIMDLGGFAASSFKRGMRFINVPTTLLGQVDASVGGKTGVNFNGLKNEIGVFAEPEKVIMDTAFFETLSKRQILSGYGEIMKYGLLEGGTYYDDIFSINPLEIESDKLQELIKRSVEIKYRIVKKDPKEMNERQALNFGHTAGHALESIFMAERKEVLHGEALAYGIVLELYLSVLKMGFDSTLYDRIKDYIYGLYHVQIENIDEKRLYEFMLHDKKNRQEGVNFTLLKAPGDYVLNCYCGKEKILTAIRILSNL